MASVHTVSSARRAMVLTLAIAIAAGAAYPAGASARWTNDASETGQQGDLVNRPGCWLQGERDNRLLCEMAGTQ